MIKSFLVVLLFLTGQLLQANEIDQLKVSLKQGFPDISEADLKTAEKFETNKEKTILTFYVKDKVYFAHKKTNDTKWIFSEAIDQEGLDLVEFKSGQRFSISLSEGGTNRSETVSTWRLDGETFKIIGQDSKAFSGWNQGAVNVSVNYLSGKVKANSSSAKRKKRSGTCKFEVKEFKDQRLSDIGAGVGAKEPDCKYAEMPNI